MLKDISDTYKQSNPCLSLTTQAFIVLRDKEPVSSSAQNPQEGKSLFKLNVTLKSNSLANIETETQRDWTWFRRVHNVKIKDAI